MVSPLTSMTPETVDDLVRRVEAATGPDLELDALIYCWHCSKSAFADASERMAYLRWAAPDYTASIDAALALVERRLPGRTREVLAEAIRLLSHCPDADWPRRLPLAILAALLRATRSTEA